MRSPIRTRIVPVLAAGALLAAAACGDDDGDAGAEPSQSDAPPPEPDADLSELSLSLTEIGQFDRPMAIASRPDDTSLFVAEKPGRVVRVAVEGEGQDRTYTPDQQPVVDISDEVVDDANPNDERGLLDIEFSPDGARLYLSYSLAPDGETRVVSYDYQEPQAPARPEAPDESAESGEAQGAETPEGTQPGNAEEPADLAEAPEGVEPEATPTPGTEASEGTQDPEQSGDAADAGVPTGGATVDEGSRREVLALPQPFPNHNGGNIVFGPDDFLYVALGDGGAGGDPEGNGQDTSTLLGSILRIDPEATAESGEPYDIPEDNPFVGGEDGQPEIWLHGVRNPWRFSFDAVTGDLWVGDVGQDAWEEVSMLPAEDGAGAGRGANLGWNEMEGTRAFEGGSNPSEGVLPVFDYPIPDEGCAVTGGYVYSGAAIPDLDAVYLFGDFCNPVLRGLRVVDGQATTTAEFEDIQVEQLVSFGEDNEGEIYLVSQAGPIHRLDP